MTASDSFLKPRPTSSSSGEAPPAPLSGIVPTSRGEPTPLERCENFLAPGARFEGTLVVNESVRLEGSFSGEIQTNGTLQIAKGAHVKAKVQAAFIVIAGAFEGQIESRERVDLLPTGQVRGDLRTKRLVVEDGAKFDGNLEMAGDSTTPPSRSSRG